MNHKLQVYFLGQFKIILDERYELSYDNIGSKKNAKLLAYLLKNYNIKLTSQEIQTTMFSDDSSSNPANALKALVYRLRTILKKHLGGMEIILSGNSTYFINPELEVELDIDRFDSLLDQGGKESERMEKINAYQEALSCYRGAFLPMFSDEQWVIISGTYLESSFMSTAVYLLKAYLDDKRYDEVEKLSKKALDFDPLNEQLHYYLIQSLKLQGKTSIAKQHYLSTEKLLYDELGIHPNEDLQQLYDSLMGSSKLKEATMNDIQNSLIEDKIIGAFQCSYKTFKKIYQLDVRKMIRTGDSEYIVLLTIEANERVMKNKDVVEAVLESTSAMLNQTISVTLRSGDTFTKYSTQQYLILLPNCNDENARKVVERIIDHFYLLDKYKRVNIISKIDEIKLAQGNDTEGILPNK